MYIVSLDSKNNMAAILTREVDISLKPLNKMTAINLYKTPPMFAVLKNKGESFEDLFTKT